MFSKFRRSNWTRYALLTVCLLLVSCTECSECETTVPTHDTIGPTVELQVLVNNTLTKVKTGDAAKSISIDPENAGNIHVVVIARDKGGVRTLSAKASLSWSCRTRTGRPGSQGGPVTLIDRTVEGPQDAQPGDVAWDTIWFMDWFNLERKVACGDDEVLKRVDIPITATAMDYHDNTGTAPVITLRYLN